MRYSLCLCQASVRQSRTVPPATAAQVSQVAPSSVNLASIKSRVSRADCVTRSGDPKESQCPELGFAVVYALSPETIPFIAPTVQRSPPSALTMLKNGVEAKTIQAGGFEDPQDHLL